jgi:hypothetical protein
MSVARNIFLAFALLIFVSRFFTGIVYEYGDPTTYLVLKHTPSLVIEQENRSDRPVRDRFTIIDADENELLYQTGYTFIMEWAFGIIAVSLGLAWIFHRRRVVR